MKIIRNLTIAIDRCINNLQFVRKKVMLPRSVKIFGRLALGCPKGAKIEFGENVIIRSGWRENPAGGGRTRLIVGSNGILKIGKESGISNSIIVAYKCVDIGQQVKIGVNCTIYDTDFHSVEYEKRMQLPDTNIKTAPVTIEDGVWICGNCIILKGVRIGARSVVAAGSVVTKSIPADELWGGNPAKFIRNIYQ